MVVVMLVGCEAAEGPAGQSDSSELSGTPETQPIGSPASIASTTTSEPRTLDELGSALVALGVDLETAPPLVRSMDDATLCGVEQQSHGDLIDGHLDEMSRRCFVDHHMSAQPAVFVEEFPTVEGDPIVTVWRTLADGSIAVDVDSSRDAYGSGTWSSHRCSRLTTKFPAEAGPFPASYFGCVDASDTTAPLTTSSALMPTWFVQRQTLPLCGYEIRLDDAVTAARECFADAATASSPAEYAHVSTGDEGERSARWFRSLGEGAYEVFEWQSGANVGASSTDSPSTWLRYECTTIEFLDAAAGDLAGVPLLNDNGECSTPESLSPTSGPEIPPAAVEDTLGCSSPDELDEILVLLRSGQPTYDYQPARDLAQLVGWTDVSITGSLDAAGRTPDNSYTVFSVSSVEVLAGSGEVDEFASSSLWASGQGPDPLADEVRFDGLRFVALLGVDPDAPGGWQPYAVEGLVLGCDDADVAVDSFDGVPSYLAGLSLVEIAEAIRAVDD